MNDGRWKIVKVLQPPGCSLPPNLETRQLQLLAAVTLLQGLPSTFLGRSSRGGDVERRWGGQFSFLQQLKSPPVHLGKKEKLQNQNWQHNLCSPVQILWHLLTSVKEKCYGDKLLYSQCHQNTQLPIWKNNRVCLCFIFWQQSPRTFPWCLIGRRGRSESIARVRLNYQPQEVTGLRYPILPNSSPRRTTFAQK